jgi:hypothetical protein
MVEIADGLDKKRSGVEFGTNYNSHQKLGSICVSISI